MDPNPPGSGQQPQRQQPVYDISHGGHYGMLRICILLHPSLAQLPVLCQLTSPNPSPRSIERRRGSRLTSSSCVGASAAVRNPDCPAATCAVPSFAWIHTKVLAVALGGRFRACIGALPGDLGERRYRREVHWQRDVEWVEYQNGSVADLGHAGQSRFTWQLPRHPHHVLATDDQPSRDGLA